ncbi:MAG: transglycosylase SLT domain-containing protein [Methylococcales bacterium]|nr:transglycosylase SLT domain-containing protein [Methylococcales bacterium]
MRLFILMLNFLVGSSLLAQSADILAASTDKNNVRLGHSPHVHGKNKNVKAHTVKQKAPHNPGDVWVRIRSGMQIPRPSPVQIQAENTPTKNNNALLPTARPTNNILSDTSNSPMTKGIPPSAQSASIAPATIKIKASKSPSAPYYNYTPYGRLKLNSAIALKIRKDMLIEKQAGPSKDNLFQVQATGQSRVRTRIEPHSLHPKPNITIATVPLTPTLAPAKSVDGVPKANPTPAPTPSEQDLAAAAAERAKQQIMYDRVKKHIVWHTQHRDYLSQVAERARPYLYHIVESLSQHKLPYELALLPIVESAYQPTALSPKSAAGLWQFIPSTGQEFDLQQNENYDARLDITASTQAAMRFLSFLKQHFNGDWLLALAAYNCGLGTVDNAIKRNLAEGLATDYWSLQLPEETQEYVPRFLALSSIFADPAAHGLKLAPVRNEPYFVKVKIDRKHDVDYLAEKDFKEVAQLANLSYEQFNRLNPGYLNPKLAADGPFTFFLPPANAKQLHQQLTSIAQFLDGPMPVKISSGLLERKPSSAQFGQQAALPLLTDLTLPPLSKVMNIPGAFLSLDVDNHTGARRLARQSALPLIDIGNGTLNKAKKDS